MAHIISPIISGYNALDVDIECSLAAGLPSLIIVGLATKSVEESKERIRSAIVSSGYKFPKKKITINLAPADITKNSASLDLAIALAILNADKQIILTSDIVAIGELGLNGDIRPVRGAIGLLRHHANSNKTIFLPFGNSSQAQALSLENAYVASKLADIIEHINHNRTLVALSKNYDQKITKSETLIDFAEIIGQDAAKRALVIAAAGGHNILLSGPPGTGKSMLSKAFIGILPDLSLEQSLETTHIHSLAGLETSNILNSPPLRSPHHTSSNVSLVGGGHNLKPGEISLAHNGVLFLDELPEFQRTAIESLRQPLEDNVISISRAQQSTTYPCSFVLIATSNPCPCGYYNSQKNCTCSANDILRYQKKLSGPILDRIDIHFTVSLVDHKNLLKNSDIKESPQIKNKVLAARKKQIDRIGNLNSKLSNKQIKQTINLTEDVKDFLNSASEKLNISARSYMKTIKIAQTIADLNGDSSINKAYISEALQYRPKQTLL